METAALASPEIWGKTDSKNHHLSFRGEGSIAPWREGEIQGERVLEAELLSLLAQACPHQFPKPPPLRSSSLCFSFGPTYLGAKQRPLITSQLRPLPLLLVG